MIVVDTNVVSELMRRAPAAVLTDWFDEQDRRALRVSAVTVAELLYGIERLPAGARRAALTAALDRQLIEFPEDVLPFDLAAAQRYADIVSARDEAGIPIAALDAQIAAICVAHGATLATRNTKDFTGTGLDLVDPWQSG